MADLESCYADECPFNHKELNVCNIDHHVSFEILDNDRENPKVAIYCPYFNFATGGSKRSGGTMNAKEYADNPDEHIFTGD